MGQPGMRITVNAAMRARDVSRPGPEGGKASPATAGGHPKAASGDDAEPTERPGGAAGRTSGKRTRAAKNERRRLDKRGASRKPPANGL